MPSYVWDEFTYPFTNFNGANAEVWEWISHFIPHLVMDVITYLCIKVNPYYRQTSNISGTSVGLSSYIIILDLTHGFNGLGKDNYKTREKY